MGGKFDENLPINGQGCLSPAGPLDLEPGETPVRLDAWVFQQGGACVAVQRVFPARKMPDVVERITWTADPDPKTDHTGAMFMPGDATAMALIVFRTANGQTRTFQWTDDVKLV